MTSPYKSGLLSFGHPLPYCNQGWDAAGNTAPRRGRATRRWAQFQQIKLLSHHSFGSTFSDKLGETVRQIGMQTTACTTARWTQRQRRSALTSSRVNQSFATCLARQVLRLTVQDRHPKRARNHAQSNHRLKPYMVNAWQPLFGTRMP